MIEFRPNEKFCRWNGILMTPETCIDLFGVEEEVIFEDGYIDAEDAIYTDLPINELLLKIGDIYETTNGNDTIEFDLNFIKYLKVKPYADFEKDYPKFNRQMHDAFYFDLDKFYEEGNFKHI